MNEVALITGASKGLGKSIAMKLSLLGIKVILVARKEDELKEVAEEINNNGCEACYIIADLSKEGSVEYVIENAKKKYGHIDILINNAGRGGMASIEKLTPKLWNSILNLNLTVPFMFVHYLISDMKNRNKGIIINISSEASYSEAKYLGAYGISKCGLNKLIEQIDIEYRDMGIKVYSICPGWIDTSLAISPELIDINSSEILKPDDISEMIKWLIEQPQHVRVGPIISIAPTNSKANLKNGVEAYIEEQRKLEE